MIYVRLLKVSLFADFKIPSRICRSLSQIEQQILEYAPLLCHLAYSRAPTSQHENFTCSVIRNGRTRAVNSRVLTLDAFFLNERAKRRARS
jgi:hypothetical protein